jgi:hypothetical protein
MNAIVFFIFNKRKKEEEEQNYFPQLGAGEPPVATGNVRVSTGDLHDERPYTHVGGVLILF